jgi:hypothetical protein
MLILDQRTLQIKYRVPAAEIYRLSLSPYLDDVAVFHVRAVSSNCDRGESILMYFCISEFTFVTPLNVYYLFQVS